MNILKLTLLAGAALVAVSGASQAAVMTTSGGSFSLTQFTDYEQQIGMFAKFNGDAGTLLSVSFTVSYGFDSTITVTAGQSASFGSVSTNSAAMFESSDANVQSVLNALVNTAGTARIAGRTLTPVAYNLMGTVSDYNLAAGTSTSPIDSSANGGPTTYTTTNASQLSAFIASNGSTSFDAYGKTLTATILQQGGGNASSTQTTTASQSISVLYTYQTPDVTVPEPASLALLGLGLIGAGAIRRKFV